VFRGLEFLAVQGLGSGVSGFEVGERRVWSLGRRV
jgi:hypothetical protein